MNGFNLSLCFSKPAPPELQKRASRQVQDFCVFGPGYSYEAMSVCVNLSRSVGLTAHASRLQRYGSGLRAQHGRAWKLGTGLGLWVWSLEFGVLSFELRN
eukprot:3222933-Rhodomonas_salina.1